MYSMKILIDFHFLKKDSECKHKQLQLTQIISTVFDNKRISKNNTKSILCNFFFITLYI